MNDTIQSSSQYVVNNDSRTTFKTLKNPILNAHIRGMYGYKSRYIKIID